VSWITRTIGYSVGAVAIAVAWYVAGNVLLVKHYADCMELASVALRATALEIAKARLPASTGGPAGGDARLLADKETVFAPPSAPKDYVGTAGRTGKIGLSTCCVPTVSFLPACPNFRPMPETLPALGVLWQTRQPENGLAL
jgi:hypothetical protein